MHVRVYVGMYIGVSVCPSVCMRSHQVDSTNPTFFGLVTMTMISLSPYNGGSFRVQVRFRVLGGFRVDHLWLSGCPAGLQLIQKGGEVLLKFRAPD